MDELLTFEELGVVAAEQRCPEFLLEALNDNNVLAGWTHVTQAQVRAGPGQKHLLSLGRGGGKPRCRFAHTSQRLLEGDQCPVWPSARKLPERQRAVLWESLRGRRAVAPRGLLELGEKR